MVTFDQVEALRSMRQGVAFLLVLAAGALVANLSEITIVGDTFIGILVGYLLSRVITITSKIRELELADPD
jgi:hypothetical protein